MVGIKIIDVEEVNEKMIKNIIDRDDFISEEEFTNCTTNEEVKNVN